MFFTALQIFAIKKKVLFLGNSYTAVNDLPNTLRQLALSLGDTIEVDSYTPGGYTFYAHTNDANTLAKIQTPGWDFVILQAQSQEPSFPPAQVATDTYPYAMWLDSAIHATNPCAETVFYMTWGRKNGDAVNCAIYPPVCTYLGMQQRLYDSYMEMSMLNHATCSPVGAAWRKCRDVYPNIELYQADESHPSMNGTYLAACTFYTTLYHKSTVGSQYLPVGVGNGDAFYIQTICSNLVLDSLETWQEHGNLPKASFNYIPLMNTIAFANASNRSTKYMWDFGDGSPIDTNKNTSHIYTSIGNYNVVLSAMNDCNFIDTFSQNVLISVINNIQSLDENSKDHIVYNQYNQILSWDFDAVEITVYNNLGQKIIGNKLNDRDRNFYIDKKNFEIYFIKITDKNGNNFSKKIQ